MTSQMDGGVCVGESDPCLVTTVLVMIRVLLPLWRPLDHHEQRDRAVVQQTPGQRHTGAVDE